MHLTNVHYNCNANVLFVLNSHINFVDLHLTCQQRRDWMEMQNVHCGHHTTNSMFGDECMSHPTMFALQVGYVSVVASQIYDIRFYVHSEIN